MPLPIAVGLLSGLRDYLHLHAMASLDLEQSFGGDMRGVEGRGFMSAYLVAQNMVHQIVVRSIRPAPLEVALTVPVGTTPPPAYIDVAAATLLKYQDAHQDGAALRPDAAAREAIRNAVVSGRGPLPADPTPEFSATSSQPDTRFSGSAGSSSSEHGEGMPTHRQRSLADFRSRKAASRVHSRTW
jgi:hypothetical protein